MVAALYRRYRPESFAEMIGQSQVTDPLMTALRTGRIGHAYLFSGPRGCGKTTSARILARCLNCAEGPTDTPCGVCPSCVELSREGGGSLDVVEIDAASHGGVDDARDLRERAVFAPARDRFKIFIIDEAHMVTPGGFNALLKIVEEPPPHVKFIFATTEPDKVIGTIRSRTHHYPFRLIAPGTLIDYVQSLCESESVQVEPGVLPLVVRAGGGSVRDTLSILDQLIAGSETSLVTSDRASGLLGFTHTELLDDVVSAFGMDDPSAAFHATDRVVQTGQDPRRFVEDLLERLRDLIVVGATTVDGAAAVFRGVPQDQLTRMFEQAQRFAPGQLSRIADVVSAALDKMAGATAPRLQLELMVARVLVQAGAGAGAGATGAQGAQGQANAAQVQAPQGSVQPQAGRPQGPHAPQGAGNASVPDKPNPLSAVAAARSAATQAPVAAPLEAPQPPVQEQDQVAAQRQGAAQAQESAQEQAQLQNQAQGAASTPASTDPSAPAPAPASPNAAQTAASIREFLREESAGATEASSPADVPGDASGSNPAPSQPTTPQPVSARPNVAPNAGGSAARESGGEPDKPHPNAGAAGFGRPISDVLSAAQIESIGSEPTRPATPSAAPTAPAQSAPPAAPAAGVPTPAGPEGTTAGSAAADPRLSTAAPTGESAAGEAGVPSDGTETGFDDLLELWPDLLEEILESDRGAWNAVHPVVPLGLDGDVLTIGLATESDLAAFKTAGAGPLRETILTAVGISVKYKPTRMPAGSAPAAQGAVREPRPDADAEEPHQADPTDPIARATARLNGLGPALAAPAWADPPVESAPKAPVAAPITSPSSVPAAAPDETDEPDEPDVSEIPTTTASEPTVIPTAPEVIPSSEDATSEVATPEDATSVDIASEVANSPEVAEREPTDLESTEPKTTGPETATADGVPSSSAAARPDAEDSESEAPAVSETPHHGGAAPVEAELVEARSTDTDTDADAGAHEPGRATASQVTPAATQPTSQSQPVAPSAAADPFAAGDPYGAADEMPSDAFDDDPYGGGYREESERFSSGSSQGNASRGITSQSADETDVSDVSDRAAAAIAATAATAAAAGPRGAGANAGNATAASSGPETSAGPHASAPAVSGAFTGNTSSAAAPAVDGPQQQGADGDTSSNRSAPAFTRYGEAVVREVLGARFVEERPLPPR